MTEPTSLFFSASTHFGNIQAVAQPSTRNLRITVDGTLVAVADLTTGDLKQVEYGGMPIAMTKQIARLSASAWGALTLGDAVAA